MLFNQQQFMGASIRSFNASLGWGSSPSNLEVALVADPKRKVLANNFQGESFVPYPVGTPATFAFSGVDNSVLPPKTIAWYYNGIVSSYRQDNSSTGSPLFYVTLTDPKEILNGTQLILDDYFGSVSGIPNVLNVFGAVEDIMGLNSTAPGYTGNFGGMQRNSTGTPWWVIRDAIHYLSSGLLSEHYGTFLKLKDRKYTVNLSDLPQTLSSGYRIDLTDNMTLMNYIDDVCQAASYDYFVELNKLYDGSNNLILDESLKPIHEIKVCTINRSYLPQPSAIINFIANTSGASVKNMGVEFRNQTNAKFLLGGNVQNMYFTYDSGWLSKNEFSYENDNIHQFYGVGQNNNLLPEFRPTIDEYIGKNKKANPIIAIDTRNLDSRIYNSPIYYTNIEELKACLSSIEAWKDYLLQTEMYKYIPIKNQDESWLVNKGVTVEDGVLTQYTRKFDNTKVEDLCVPYKILITQKNNPANWFVYNLKMSPFMNQDFNTFITDFENQFFPNVPINQPPSPNPSLLNDGVNIISLSTYQKVIDKYIQKSKFNVEYIVEVIGFFFPVDADGYGPACSYDTEDREINIGNDKIVIKDFKKHRYPKYTTYKHSNVINIHYKKYHKILKLSGGGNQDQFIKVLSILTQANSLLDNDVNKKMLLSECREMLSKSSLDIVKQEEDQMRIQAFYDFLLQYARNIGTKYMVKMPNILIAKDFTYSGIIPSMSPVNEGYLSKEEYNSAQSAGLLPVNYFNLTTENNMLQPYAYYPSAYLYELSHIPETDIAYSYQSDGSRKDIYIKCSIEEDLYYIDRYAHPSAVYPKAVITLPGIINLKEEYDKRASLGTSFFLENLDNAMLQQNYSNVVGADDLFEFAIPEPIQPFLVAIPLKNHTLSYGPWANVGATGIIEYERDETLVPWNYGGYSGLNEAALTKISEVARQQQDEQGSIEFPGMPTISLGHQLEWIANGSTYYGPYITDITVDIGEQGLKTAYKMQTWTPKFGKLSKQREEDIRKNGELSQRKQRKHLINKISSFNQKTKRINDIFNILKKGGDSTIKTAISKSMRYSSSHNILAGQVEGFLESGHSTFDTKVVNQPAYNTLTQVSDDYNNKAFVSLDAVFRPYSTYNLHSGYLPYFESIDSGYKDFANSSFMVCNDYHPFPYGHDINVVTRDEQIPDDGLLNMGRYSQDMNYRGIGLKGPVIIVGYGKTLEGKPVPNYNQFNYDESGRYIFDIDGNEYSDNYAIDYLSRPDMWKAGPLNIRWDNRGKMWSPGSILVEGYLIEDMPAAEGRFSSVPFTSGRMVLCAGSYANTESGYQPKMWDRADASGYYTSGLLANGGSGLVWRSSGTIYGHYAYGRESGGRPDIFVLLINRSTQLSALSGTYIIASPMPNGELRPIWVDCETSERLGLE